MTLNLIFQFWSGSELAKEFVDCLLEIDSQLRLSAVDALKHEWITGEKHRCEV